jgi:hypothetical protein
MSTTRKVAIGLGIAGGALLAAWLLTGDRKKKTKDFIAKKANDLKRTLIKDEGAKEGHTEDSDVHYV